MGTVARVSRGSAVSETREYGRSAALLTLALGSAGLLAYAFFAVASHTLDRDAYGEIVVLWSVVFVGASTLFRPIEQLLSRTLAEREEVGEEIGPVLRVAALIQAGLALAAVALLLALREPISDNLLEGGDLLFWVLVAAMVGYGAAFFARGFLAGRRLFGYYATLLVLEGSARLAAETEPEFTLSRGGAFAAAVLVMMLSEQIIVSSGALFVRATEGAAAAGFIFNVLMVARAPLVLFQATAASLLPHLTRLRTRGDATGREAFRMSVNTTLLTIAGFAAVVTMGVLAVGPEVMQIAFGDKFTYDRAGLVIVAIGMGFYLCGAALNQAALAQGQARRAAVCWVVCAAAFVVWNLVAPLDPFRTVEVGFAGSAALLAGLLYLLYARPRPLPADAFEPGSPREIEARLASADEIG